VLIEKIMHERRQLAFHDLIPTLKGFKVCAAAKEWYPASGPTQSTGLLSQAVSSFSASESAPGCADFWNDRK